jgi:serine/threonine-protein kinase RsbW
MPTNLTMDDGPPPDLDGIVWDRQFPSLPETKDEVVYLIIQALSGIGWILPDDEPWLQLCLDEAIMNAMVHGNEADAAAQVRVRIGRRGDRWVVQVDDEGSGFDLSEIPDPDDDTVLVREHGRGVMLLREWLDRVAYFRHGASLVMERGIPADVEVGASTRS